jgi:ABC-type glycerol-3-phosphate transport system substrate-binding protein
MTLTRRTFTTFGGLLTASALTLAACGGGEDARDGRDSSSASQGAAQSGGEALAALGLAEPGRATWG